MALNEGPEPVPAYAERLAWLEAQEAETPPEQRGRRLAVRGWAALWPKVLAIVIVLGAAPSIANGLIAGVDYTPPLLLRASKMMGLRRLSRYRYRYLILPASLPAFVAGLKQGWAFSRPRARGATASQSSVTARRSMLRSAEI